MKNGSILIFGGTGFLGHKLIEKYMTKFNSIGVFSRDEAKHWKVKNKFKNIDIFVGDIRDKNRVNKVINDFMPSIIIIASAMKNIVYCEDAPLESIKTNILGINNIISSCENKDYIKKCIFVSTDKACSPVNVYGMCKAISEHVMAKYSNNKNTDFISVRYGNILGSTGSVIPLFKYQCENNDYITVTHENMTRFYMTCEQSVELIDKTMNDGESGDIWIPILDSMKIMDLANIFAKKYNKKIKITGIRPGEKIYEELINCTESINTIKKDNYYIIKPAYHIVIKEDYFTYNSNQNLLSISKLEEKLNKYKAFG